MDEIYRSQFRMPYALYEQLKASADANHRSVNAELVARLEDSFIPRSMDDIERDSLSKLERELADLSIESFKLTHEMNSLQAMLAKTSESDARPLRERLAELAPQIARLEAHKHQRLQAVAAIKHFQK
jgi:uncharacterized protein YlxW (UPF0749 family)